MMSSSPPCMMAYCAVPWILATISWSTRFCNFGNQFGGRGSVSGSWGGAGAGPTPARVLNADGADARAPSAHRVQAGDAALRGGRAALRRQPRHVAGQQALRAVVALVAMVVVHRQRRVAQHVRPGLVRARRGRRAVRHLGVAKGDHRRAARAGPARFRGSRLPVAVLVLVRPAQPGGLGPVARRGAAAAAGARRHGPAGRRDPRLSSRRAAGGPARAAPSPTCLRGRPGRAGGARPPPHALTHARRGRGRAFPGAAAIKQGTMTGGGGVRRRGAAAAGEASPRPNCCFALSHTIVFFLLAAKILRRSSPEMQPGECAGDLSTASLTAFLAGLLTWRGQPSQAAAGTAIDEAPVCAGLSPAFPPLSSRPRLPVAWGLLPARPQVLSLRRGVSVFCLF